MNQLELFKMFCGNDKIRPAMLLPFERNGFIYATDAHVLIRCEKQYLEFELTNTNNSLNTDKVIPLVTCNRIISTKLEDLEIFKTEDELVKQGEDIECTECDGDGEVEWEYMRHTKTDDCPVCDGSGYESEGRLVPNGKKTFPPYTYVSIDGVLFNINFFKLILTAKEIINEPLILLNFVNEKNAALFKIGIYELIIMSVYNDGSYKALLEVSFD